MQNDMMTFELATHFLPKVSLKIETFVQSMMDAQTQTHPVIHLHALQNCLDILTIVEKPGLKSRFLKEFLRIEHLINRGQTHIDNELYDLLFQQIQFLNGMNQHFAQDLSKDLFLLGIRQNQSANHNIDGDFCPQLQFWRDTDPSLRSEMIENWLQIYYPLYKTVRTYLTIIRQSAVSSMIKLDRGFYQQAISPGNQCYLIVIKLAKWYGAIPKINLGNFGLSVRLFNAQTMQALYKEEAEMELAFCQL